MRISMKKRIFLLTLVLITIASLAYRAYGLSSNSPFWVDEFNSGTQAKLIQEHGASLITDADLRKSAAIEFQNIPTHVIIALFFQIFDDSEVVARLPFAIIGGLLPLVMFFWVKRYSDELTAIIASLITAFLHIQILWSVQARGYVLLQMCVLLSFYFYRCVKQEKVNIKRNAYLFGLLGIAACGVLSHITYVFVLVAIGADLIFYHQNRKRALLQVGFFAGIILLMASYTGMLSGIQTYISTNYSGTNNVWYYHSFLWREYTLLAFLGIYGILLLALKKKSILIPEGIFMLCYSIFILFIYGHHMTKYLLPIIPFLIAGMSISLIELAKSLNKFVSIKLEHLAFVITLLIIANGNIFATKPKQYYSLNTHFREISNIDYHSVYEKILPHKDESPAVIETWPGRMYWYLGNDYPNGYMFRWENEEGFANGHSKKTAFYLEKGEKRISKQIGFVGSKDDLEKIIKKNKVGFLFIDDSSLPLDVIQYAEKNLKKELYLDHYPLDDNPYSIWPATLYSWGVQ